MGLPPHLPDLRISLQNFSPVGLSVLVVDDDPLCLIVLDRLLRQCSYKVTTCNRVAKALALLRENSDSFDLVICDVYMPNKDGFKLLEVIGLELDLPVIMMSAIGETSVVMKGITHGACDYLVKPVRMEELRNIWQHVVRRRGRDSYEDYHGDAEDCDTLIECQDSFSKKRKEQIPSDDDVVDDSSSLKKARVNWSVQLHQQFVNAVNRFGIDKAVPKKILDIMNVQGLSRENVASHLQKYRLYLKRLSGVMLEPCPVASFQASDDGDFGGYMQVKPGGQACLLSTGVKGLNFGTGTGGTCASPRAGMVESPESNKSLVHHPANQQRQAANRAQVLGGLGLVNVKWQNGGGVSANTSSPREIQRMSSLDLGVFLKAEAEDVPSDQEGGGSISCLDDLAVQDFRSIVKLEEMETAGSSRNNNNPTLNGIVVESLVNQLGCSKSDLEDSARNAWKIQYLQERRPVSHLMVSGDSNPLTSFNSAASFSEDYSSSSVTCLSNEANVHVTSSDTLTDLFRNGDYFSSLPLDVSDYLVDEIFSHQD